MYGLCGKMKAHPGQGEALLKHMLSSAAHMEAVVGCHLYVIGTLPDEPDTLWITEVWETQEAHRGSLNLEWVKASITVARPLIADMSEGFEFVPVGGKGLPTGS